MVDRCVHDLQVDPALVPRPSFLGAECLGSATQRAQMA
jgi:hypothetical protein